MSEIKADALVHFDDPNKYDSDGGAALYRIINRVYREVCRKTRCSRTSSSITTIANTREYALPSGCIALGRVEIIPTGYTTGYRIMPIRPTDISIYTGLPTNYYLAGATVIGLDPLPDGAYKVNLVYYTAPTTELTSTETPTLVPTAWHHVIVYGTVAMLFAIDQGDDGQGAVKWRALYEKELRDFKHFLGDGSNADVLPGVR